jgi:hypothetical protein
MRRVVINGFAILGALVVVGIVFNFVVQRLGGRDVTVAVRGLDASQRMGIPVFLDRGKGDIQRFVTNAEGRVRLPLERREMPRAAWLICAPGAVPMVGHHDPQLIGPTTYEMTRQPPAGPFWNVRRSGWGGPIPRECVADSTWVWRYPASSGRSPDEASRTEPDWSVYPAPPGRP